MIPVFSAGNSGSGSIPHTDGAPANNPGAFSVGAIDNNSLMWYSSGRGPNSCDASLPFPYLVAPGVNVLSSVPGVANYATLTGTSMAAPHVSGAIALLLSAFPGVPPILQEYALTRGAFPLNTPVPDYNTGYGRLDVLVNSAAPILNVSLTVFLSSVRQRRTASQRSSTSSS